MNEVTILGNNYDGALDEDDIEEGRYCLECGGSGWVPTSPLDEGHYDFFSDMTKVCERCCGDGYEY